jgi:formate hydrogenlyase transcriptional activator
VPDVDEEHSLTRLAAEALPHGVAVVDAEGTILLVNRELERQFGYARAELTGQPIKRLLPDNWRAAGEQPCETVARRRDGTDFPVEIRLNPFKTAGATLILATIVDITSRKKSERANQTALEEQFVFERLIAYLTVQFINLPADRVSETIRMALGLIADALDLDRCTFYEIAPDGTLTVPVSWEREGIPAVPTPMPAKQRFPWAFEKVFSGTPIHFSSVDEIPSPEDRASYVALGVKSTVTVPLSVGGQVVGGVAFNMIRAERAWSPETVHRLCVIGAAFGNVLTRRRSDEAVAAAHEEVKSLSVRLQAENVYLRREVKDRIGTGIVVGQSEAIRRVMEHVQHVAGTDSTVLVLGETGTGKELVAGQIHELSGRRANAMVRVNCSAIPATLIESELFGREKGAFTGALARQIGRFELANHSTIFLDEIGDLPFEVQVKLLRVIEERQIERLGSPRAIPVDVRIIAATHRDLERRIAEGAFREDLFYRLNVFPIRVPPLRDRVEDIPLLVWRFVDEFSKAFGKRIDAISRENMHALQQYGWPGNIRELRNVVERAMIVATGPRLTILLPTQAAPAGKRSARLADVEREHIRSVLESTGWRIRGPGGAADRLGLRPTTLETRLAKLGLRRPKPS